MIHEEHIRLCDDCGSILVHGICTLCGHRDMECPSDGPDGPDGPDDLDFEQPDAGSGAHSQLDFIRDARVKGV